MRVRLVPASGVPIYRQIVQQVSYQIACGRLPTGQRLPSVRELARALPANQNTVIKAYEILERDGLITRRHGDGTFVAEHQASLTAAERRRIVGEALAQAAVKGTLLGIEPAELHKLLDRQLAQISEQKGDAHG